MISYSYAVIFACILLLPYYILAHQKTKKKEPISNIPLCVLLIIIINRPVGPYAYYMFLDLNFKSFSLGYY